MVARLRCDNLCTQRLCRLNNKAPVMTRTEQCVLVVQKYHLARGSLVVCVSVSSPQSSFAVVTPNIGLPPFLTV